MSTSHVVVFDARANRTAIKVHPGKHLSDVLSEACLKLKADSSLFGLRKQGETTKLDLSRPIRLHNLSPGAKLELVQLSRSPSVVSIALQLPESLAADVPGRRLIDKFPSNTTLWAVLRKFEAGVAGGASARTLNFTARAAARTTATGESGRLFYETPVINLMGREIASFVDLQKTLGAVGCASGSVLLRLTFRVTETPMEVAMKEIETYFREVEAGDDEKQTQDSSRPSGEEGGSNVSEEAKAEGGQQTKPTEELTVPPTQFQPETSLRPEAVLPQESLQQQQQQQISDESTRETTQQTPSTTTTTTASRPTAVYAPPRSSKPQATQQSYREEDYVPTVDQARTHQRNLQTASRPQRLASDAELAAHQQATDARLAAVREVEIKIRFPDQSQVVSKFGRADSCAGLYAYVRSCMREDLAAGQPFVLFCPGGGSAAPATAAGVAASPNPAGTLRKASATAKPTPAGLSRIPDDERVLLIRDMKMAGRVLVQCLQQPGADGSSKDMTRDVLRPELRAAAGEIKVEEPPAEEPAEPSSSQGQGAKEDRAGKAPASASAKEHKLRNWLKLPGKK